MIENFFENKTQTKDNKQIIIECDKKLESISDWPMGQCGTRTTSDPRVFGPEAWITFHRFAQNYPERPNENTYDACTQFIRSIPYMLPCAHCGYDFSQFIKVNEKYENTTNPYQEECSASLEYDMPCQGPQTACESQKNLVNFFLRAHHNVDKLTKPCKPLYSPEQASIAYSNQQNFCATGIVYGTEPICKSEGETNCVAE